MKRLIFLFALLAIFSACRSVKKTTSEYHQEKDSVNYSTVEKVELDTTIIPRDTASLESVLSITPAGEVMIQEIIQDQGENISLDYAIEKTPSGSTKIKVTATSKQKEIITTNTTRETIRTENSSTVSNVEKEKTVRGFNYWNLAWMIPVLLLIILVYLKRKTILKFLPF